MAEPKTKRARKARIDSRGEISRILQGAEREIAPPAHVPLGDNDWPFWESVLGEFARADWTYHQLELAAMLARTMADCEEEQRLIREEGSMIMKPIFNSRGELKNEVQVENPRLRVAQLFMGQILNLRRSLALNTQAKAGSTHNSAVQRERGKEIERQAASENDLLA